MIKWLAKKIKNAANAMFQEHQGILCDFCDEPIDVMGPHMEYTMPEVKTQALFHVQCHEENRPTCAVIIAHITAAGEARKKELLAKLPVKDDPAL